MSDFGRASVCSLLRRSLFCVGTTFSVEANIKHGALQPSNHRPPRRPSTVGQRLRSTQGVEQRQRCREQPSQGRLDPGRASNGAVGSNYRQQQGGHRHCDRRQGRMGPQSELRCLCQGRDCPRKGVATVIGSRRCRAPLKSELTTSVGLRSYVVLYDRTT